MEVQVNSNMPQLASFGSVFTPSWAQWRQHGEPCFKRSAIDSKKAWKIQVKTGVLKISDWAGYASHLKPYGRQLGLKLLPNGSHFGAKGVPSWSQVGPKLGPSRQVGPKLGSFWPKWTQVGPTLRPCWIETVHLDDFGPICELCKLPVLCAFSRLVPGEHGPPHLYHFHLQLQHDNTQLDVDIH